MDLLVIDVLEGSKLGEALPSLNVSVSVKLQGTHHQASTLPVNGSHPTWREPQQNHLELPLEDLDGYLQVDVWHEGLRQRKHLGDCMLCMPFLMHVCVCSPGGTTIDLMPYLTGSRGSCARGPTADGSEWHALQRTTREQPAFSSMPSSERVHPCGYLRLRIRKGHPSPAPSPAPSPNPSDQRNPSLDFAFAFAELDGRVDWNQVMTTDLTHAIEGGGGPDSLTPHMADIL